MLSFGTKVTLRPQGGARPDLAEGGPRHGGRSGHGLAGPGAPAPAGGSSANAPAAGNDPQCFEYAGDGQDSKVAGGLGPPG